MKKPVVSIGNIFSTEAIPRINNYTEIFNYKSNIGEKKIEEFMGNLYLHSIKLNPNTYINGIFSKDEALVFIEACKDAYSYLLKNPDDKKIEWPKII
jgi:hypothetical protein